MTKGDSVDDSNTVKLTKKDFDLIRSIAIQKYNNSAFPKDFNNSNSCIDSSDSANFCLIETVFEYLSAKDCLKKEVFFDTKDKNK